MAGRVIAPKGCGMPSPGVHFVRLWGLGMGRWSLGPGGRGLGPHWGRASDQSPFGQNLLGLQRVPRQFFLQLYHTFRSLGETR